MHPEQAVRRIRLTVWNLEFAQSVGEDLVQLLAPHCERIEIAGSIRRRRLMVGDIELLCISRVIGSSSDMFGGVGAVGYALDTAIDELVTHGSILLKRRSMRGRCTYGRQNKLLTHVPTGIPVDVFAATQENWGMAQLVRTGPREWNIRVMSRFRALGMRGHAYGGVTNENGHETNCPSEESVFELLQWPYSPPARRK